MNGNDVEAKEKPSYNFALTAIAVIIAVIYKIMDYISGNVYDATFYPIVSVVIFSGILIIAALIIFILFTTVSYEINDSVFLKQLIMIRLHLW